MPRRRSALCVHAVHGNCGLQVVRVQWVVVCMRVPVGVKFVAEQCGCLRRRVQIEVVVVVTNVDAGRERVVVSRWILAVLLWTHGAVAWKTKHTCHEWNNWTYYNFVPPQNKTFK